MKALVLFSISLASCGPSGSSSQARPEITRGLSTNFFEGTAQLTKRAQVAFPIGYAESAMIADLKRQGFTEFSSDRDEEGVWHTAEYEERRFPCITGWSIHWRSKAQRVTKVWAIYNAACP